MEEVSRQPYSRASVTSVVSVGAPSATVEVEGLIGDEKVSQNQAQPVPVVRIAGIEEETIGSGQGFGDNN
eukprot:1322510-Amorphochlora_amoeboformis.AAC.1